jgi:3-deoxy-D-manno-octulosonate 8-phosphate phosphatase KdsC-like HAD superfamily phosphatase
MCTRETAVLCRPVVTRLVAELARHGVGDLAVGALVAAHASHTDTVRAALARLGISPHAAVGIGDAENDEPLVALCGCGVAVANAVPALKARASLVTRGERGAGVAEVVERLISSDPADQCVAAPSLASPRERA